MSVPENEFKLSELEAIIGDAMYPTDPWRDFSGNIWIVRKAILRLRERGLLHEPK